MLKSLLVTGLASSLCVHSDASYPVQTGQFIVRVEKDAANSEFSAVIDEFRSFAELHGTGEVIKVWPSFNMFAVELLSESSMHFLKSHSMVKFVVESRPKHMLEYSWGQDRIDQAALPLSHTYSPNFDGFQVDVYIVDTGLDTTHYEFQAPSTRTVENAYDYYGTLPSDNNDVQGHGSHCAGTIGGQSVGMSPNTNLYGVRVLNDEGSGTSLAVVSGLEYVYDQVTSVLCANPAVVSMSLGGICDDLICEEDSIITVIDDYLTPAGVVSVVAAGNDACDACISSPAAAVTAITVGASDILDDFAYFSSYGHCVDIIAPGVNITSVCANGSSFEDICFTNNQDINYLRISGTSMATPHVAGVVAQWLQTSNMNDIVTMTPAQVKQALQCTAVDGIIMEIIDPDFYTKNKFLQVAPFSDNMTLPASFLCNRGNDPDTMEEIATCPMSCGYNMSTSDSNGVCDVTDFNGCICDKLWDGADCMTADPYELVCDAAMDANTWNAFYLFNLITGDGWDEGIYYEFATNKGEVGGIGSLACNVVGTDQYCLEPNILYNIVLCVPDGMDANGANMTLSGCSDIFLTPNIIYMFEVDEQGDCSEMMSMGSTTNCVLPNTESKKNNDDDVNEAGLIGGLVGGIGGGLLLLGAAGYYMCIYTKKSGDSSQARDGLLSPTSKESKRKRDEDENDKYIPAHN